MTTLHGLRSLRNSMVRQGISRQRFEYEHRQGGAVIAFDVIYLIDTDPHHLLFGARLNALGLLFVVHPDLSVRAYLDTEEYQALCRLLGLSYDPNRRFRPGAFLEQFDGSGQIPSVATTTAVPKCHEIPRPTRHVSDGDKPYFSHWLDNAKAGNRASEKNLKRTALAFGQKYADFCAKQDISSCWTADPSKTTAETRPPGWEGRSAKGR